MDWTQGSVATVAGNGEEGFKDGPTTEEASFNKPNQVAINHLGQLIVADSGNHCIRCFDSQGHVSTISGTAQSAPTQPSIFQMVWRWRRTGPCSWRTMGIIKFAVSVKVRCPLWRALTPMNLRTGLSEACFNYPQGLALDGSDIIVADHDNHRIRRVTPQGVVTLAGNGEKGDKDGPALEASFFGPMAVAVGPNGHVMATDCNGRLCLISEGCVSTVAREFNCPCGLLVDCRGNAIMADTDNHRIVFCTPQGAVAVIAGNGEKKEEREGDFKDGPP